MVNIVLVNPKIPGNVGTIGRTCFAIDGQLHLIKPYGFGDISKKELRRAGLDYWEHLKLFEYENIEQFWQAHKPNKRHFFATTKTNINYFENRYEKDDFVYFGAEDEGLSENILCMDKTQNITIPMANDARSLNLSNSVSIIIYEIVRQNIQNI
ncbi:MAG: tRNA (cytidine(34)-2'-O)-methyltransferase [Epsilonproteobacteria bacterium]|nr:MAG: tRNA (cytidine(34)-2'-O)-methyltransferase [Campylobacterota bacterium]